MTATLTRRIRTDLVDTLSPRELQVFRLTGDGLRTNQIGRVLGISHRTVERHLAGIKSKLRVTGRDLVRLATLWQYEFGDTPRPCAAGDLARSKAGAGAGVTHEGASR